MNILTDNFEDVLRNYILHPEISIHDPEPEIIPRKPKLERLFHIPSCPASTTLVPKRDYVTGKILDFVEVELENAGANATNSMSMQREPGLLEEATRGSAMNFPFWPGGFDEPKPDNENLKIEFNLDEDLLTIPPGFKNGLYIEPKNSSLRGSHTEEINLLVSLEKENEIRNLLEFDNRSEEEPEIPEILNQDSETVDELLAYDNPAPLEISKAPTFQRTKTEWAELINTSQPVMDFEKIVPDMAKKYDFELDVFQKQAIIKLEERQFVFVAAHTSAGKTVIAEYAIALSRKHMTRTIYTSPIKALSNQKYRDFKREFGDIGLITGDYQINPTASCLIMTTEILRSMLYCGSECTRDLEYVIFDEVHYINDLDRGHVWEEVFIMLPAHVNIIMLSATVDNTLEFANWVGSTKKRKVYVVATTKRPVPLKHYLYTGCGKKIKNDIFLLVDTESKDQKFLKSNYEIAKEKIERAERRVYNDKQNSQLWVGLVDYLKVNDKLPVIAFTLSRKRCDINAEALLDKINQGNLIQLIDSGQEKEVRAKFNKWTRKHLKGGDLELRQVKHVRRLLEKGIGVHHSGILPILKEMVEDLFQTGLVKLLFATETFAMGVNMPARTVVFDSIIKYDGNQRRELKYVEYTQMAGRAGRRNHDADGTVIIICKDKMPEERSLQNMILGRPEKLESKFVLRYAMILTCLRIESIKVEEIMKNSYKESYNKKEMNEFRIKLDKVQEEYASMPELLDRLKPLCEFFDVARWYIIIKGELMKGLLSQQRVVKDMKPGRVLVVSKNEHFNKLGILLTLKAKGKEAEMRVLVLDHAKSRHDEKLASPVLDREELWYKMLSLIPQHKHFHPEGVGGHTILNIKLTDIVGVTKKVIKIEPNVIIQNWEYRQHERFKNNPPSSDVIAAVTELELLNESYGNKKKGIQMLDLNQDIEISGSDSIMDNLQQFKTWAKSLKDILPHTNIANFEEEFVPVFQKKCFELTIEELKRKSSVQVLELYPDYQRKLNVLRSLKYIDEHDDVTLKGKVACEIGQNELIVTELILSNLLNESSPAQIAALLSALVFQAKTDVIEIPPELELLKNKLEEIDDTIHKAEVENLVQFDIKERLNFGLMRVVYKWARQEPFSEIMNYTDVQEGIIVRCIQQLDDILRDVKTAAQRIGNPALQKKMEEASEAIRRDIVFVESLYTAED